MYWIRTGSTLDLIFFAALAFTWSIGGWLIVAHAFTLHGARRLLAGFTTGLLLWITLVNLLTPFVTLTVAAGLSSALLLLSGLLLAGLDVRKARRSGLQRSWLPLSDLRAWPVLAVLALLTLLLTLVGRGLAIFDDYLHIPLVSMMATGDIPPHFFKNPEARFSYHYGLQVLAAGMVGVGGFFPWSAWDISKALAIALTAVLGWIWFQGTTRSRLGAWLGSIFIVFAGGARWLLLLLPVPLLLAHLQPDYPLQHSYHRRERSGDGAFPALVDRRCWSLSLPIRFSQWHQRASYLCPRQQRRHAAIHCDLAIAARQPAALFSPWRNHFFLTALQLSPQRRASVRLLVSWHRPGNRHLPAHPMAATSTSGKSPGYPVAGHAVCQRITQPGAGRFSY